MISKPDSISLLKILITHNAYQIHFLMMAYFLLKWGITVRWAMTVLFTPILFKSCCCGRVVGTKNVVGLLIFFISISVILIILEGSAIHLFSSNSLIFGRKLWIQYSFCTILSVSFMKDEGGLWYTCSIRWRCVLLSFNFFKQYSPSRMIYPQFGLVLPVM